MSKPDPTSSDTSRPLADTLLPPVILVAILVAVPLLLGLVFAVRDTEFARAVFSMLVTYLLGGFIELSITGATVALSFPPLVVVVLLARFLARKRVGDGLLARTQRSLRDGGIRYDLVLSSAVLWVLVAEAAVAARPADQFFGASSRPVVSAALGVATVLLAHGVARSTLVQRLVRRTVLVAILLGVVAGLSVTTQVGRVLGAVISFSNQFGFDADISRLEQFFYSFSAGVALGILALLSAVNILLLAAAHGLGVPLGLSVSGPTGAVLQGRTLLQSLTSSLGWVVVLVLVILLVLWIGRNLSPVSNQRRLIVRAVATTVVTWLAAFVVLPVASIALKIRVNLLDLGSNYVGGTDFRGFVIDELSGYLPRDLLFSPSREGIDSVVDWFVSLLDGLFSYSFTVGFGARGSALGLLGSALFVALLVVIGSVVRAAADDPDGWAAPDGLTPRRPQESHLRFGAQLFRRYANLVAAMLEDRVAAFADGSSSSASPTDAPSSEGASSDPLGSLPPPTSRRLDDDTAPGGGW